MTNKRTVRYAHMEEMSHLKVGDKVKWGDLIGIMGSSGQSKFNHLHIDVVYGFIHKIIRLSEIGRNKKYIPDKKQLMYFIDKDLFGIKPFVTTTYMNKKYRKIYGKDHPAIDVVPIDRHVTNLHFGILWNRTKTGTVLDKGYDLNGYGFYILIGFEV